MSLLDRFRGPNQIPLYEDDSLDTLDEWQSSDALSFVGKNYALSAATAPFEVAATLVCVQYRGESENAAGKTADASEAAVGVAVAPGIPLGRI